MDSLLFHILVLLALIELSFVGYKRTRLNVVITLLTAMLVGAGIGLVQSAIIGITAGYLIYGGIALSVMQSRNNSYNSPTYSPQKQTQTNPDLPVPLLYGEVKVAGNRLWQDDNIKKGIKRIVAFSDGEIEDFTDIRLNDIKINDIKSAKVERFYGTGTQGLPSGVNLDAVGSLKYLAYLYIKVPQSDKININYNLTCVVKGRKVRVYTTPTQYEIKYSNNPAWVMFDFLTCYNGRGLCLNQDGEVDDNKVAELFDMQSFIESANYCDELVTTSGEQTKRFTFNMIFDSQTSHKTLLDEIQRSCRGGLFTKDGKLQFKIDKAEPVSKVFTEADILDGSETFQTLPNEENYEVLKIDYISPENEWQKVQAYAEMSSNRTGVPIEHTINAYSVTNFQQASRLAWYYLNSKRLCPYFGSFKTGFKAYDLEVGQVIEIPVILMGLEHYKVKVTSVVNNGTGTYTVNYRTYDERLYNDELGCKEPTVIVTKLTDDYGFPDDVKNFNIIQKDNYYNFSWQYNQDLDNVYEIRYGNNWENGEVIGKNIALNSYNLQIQTTGIKNFWIKAFNGYNYSQSPTLDVIVIDSIPDLNVIETYDLIKDKDGTFDRMYYYNGVFKLDVDNVLWETTENNWGIDNYYQYDGVNWGARTVQEGYYTTQIYDLLQVVSSVITRNYNFTSIDNTGNCIIEFRYSEDNINWTDWTELLGGSYNFRFIQFRIHMTSPYGTQVMCDNANIIIDVPDKFDNLEVDVTDINGSIVNYNFHNIPSIVATVNDNINAYAVIDSKTNNSALIKIYNNDGSLTTGKVSLYLKGF